MIPSHRIPTHPGEILLQEFLEPMGIPQTKFAASLGIPVQRINEIINGKRGISPDTAWLLSTARRAQDPDQFISEYDVPLHPLPCFGSMDEERAFCRKLVEEIVAETSERHEREGSKTLGVKAVLDQDPHDLPHNSIRSPAPRCHAQGRERRIDFAAAYSAFVAAYRLASDLFRSGKLDANFPDGCFPPPLPYRMAMANAPP